MCFNKLIYSRVCQFCHRCRSLSVFDGPNKDKQLIVPRSKAKNKKDTKKLYSQCANLPPLFRIDTLK